MQGAQQKGGMGGRGGSLQAGLAVRRGGICGIGWVCDKGVVHVWGW